MPRDNNRRLLQFAKQLRSSQTDAESKLWTLLRSRQLGGFKFRRQFPIGRYILDFYCVEKRLAVELDGGQHSEPAAVQYDSRRADQLARLGIQILRFWDDELLKYPDAVADEIYRHLTKEKPSPLQPATIATGISTPSPGTPGEGRGEGLRVGRGTNANKRHPSPYPSPGIPGEGKLKGRA
jgi:very-short-patch-repair endonuclease